MNTRILTYSCIAYITGVVAFITYEIKFMWIIAIALLISGIAILFAPRHKLTALLIYLGLLSGFCYALIYSSVNLNQTSQYLDKPIKYEGMVTDLRKPDGTRFTIDISKLHYDGISHEANFKAVVLSKEPKEIPEKGHTITFYATAVRPREASNTGEFDNRRFYQSRNIYIQLNAIDYEITDRTKPPFISLVSKTTKAIGRGIDRLYYEKNRAFIISLILGDKSQLSPEQIEEFSKSNTSHIVAVSGMHISIIMSYFTAIFAFGKIDRRWFSYIIKLFIVVALVILTGAQISAIRAGIMTAICLLCGLFRREYDSVTSLTIAVYALILTNPFIVFDMGLQFSACATLGIILFYTHIKKVLRSTILTTTVCAQIGILPIMALQMNAAPFFGMVANLVVVPLIPIVMMVGLLSSAFSTTIIGQVIASFGNFLTSIILMCVRWFANQPNANIVVATPSFAFICAYVSGCSIIYSLLNQRKEIWRNLAIFVGCALVLLVISFQDYAVVAFLNVGQGDAAIAYNRKGGAILIDAGNLLPSDQGEYIIFPFMKRNKIKRIDMAFISHFHEDHFGGIGYLMEEGVVNKLCMPVDDSIEYRKLIEIATDNDVEVVPLSYRMPFEFENGFEVECIYQNSKASSTNNRSAILKLSYGENDFLFTGDIEQEEERAISSIDLQSIEVLKAAHHGSDTSSSDEFMQRISPLDFAVISVGKNNYGHPSEQVVDKLKQKSSLLLRTDKHGTIWFGMNKKSMMKIRTTFTIED